MEKLHNEPDVRRQDYCAFVNELKLFHQNRGTPIRQLPKINGREIDLLKFYNQVTALGGLQKVIEGQKWNVVAEVLKLPKSCANFALGLRQIYIRFLGVYEKIHFMGEEPENEKSQSSESHHRKQQSSLFHQVPMVYNSSQHDISVAARSASGLNQAFINATDYDKLCMSLFCGLPNEQELALNVCTILSNEGNYMLHLEQTPRLVDLLLAQTGVWPKDDKSLKMLYLESWKGLKGRNIHRFWRSTLDLQNTQLVQLLGLDLGEYDPNEALFNLENDSGALNVEGQRVLRVALILHNLSFEKNNVPVLIGNSSFLRFILLCVHCSWANLKQTAYDTLSNLASKMKLAIEKDVCSRIVFQTVTEGIVCPDRYMNIRSMDILSQLCSYEPNEDIPSRLDVEVYQKMVSFLTVHDIMLLFFSLEALYALSDLGRYACDKIVCVHKCIGALVSLLTLEPNQYGQSGHINMKIVETLVPADPDSEHEDKPVTNSTEQSAISSSPAPVVSASSDIDSETFAVNWLKSMYEISSGYSLPRNEMYADYVSFCSKAGRKGVVNANVFAGCVKNAFPSCGLKKVESGTGIIAFHHDGLRRKINTTQTGPPVTKNIHNSTRKVPPTTPVSCKPREKQSHSPILKAQLSAPPRSGVTSPPLKRPHQCVPNGRKNIPSSVPNSMQQSSTLPVIPTTSGSSTLIKSLLANKVQQRNLHRQTVPHNASKMVIYSPEKVNSFSQGIMRSPTTVIRCIRPSALPGVNSAQIRTPLQARLFSNKGRVITTTSPRMLKNSPVVTSRIQPKLMKQNLLSSHVSTARLNGVQRDVQMEMCIQDEELRKLPDANYSQITQTNYLQNHISSDSSINKDSVSLNSDNLQSSKNMDMNNDLEKNCVSQNQENSLVHKCSGTSESPPSNGNLLVVRSKPSSDGLLFPKEKNGSNVNFVNNNNVKSGLSVVAQSVNHLPKINSSPSSILKSVLGDIDAQINESSKQQQLLQKDKICKRAPLLNGLLDKGKVPLCADFQSSIQNGDKVNNVDVETNSSESKSSITHVQSTLSSNVSPSSVNSVSPSQLNSTVVPISSLNSVKTETSSTNFTTSSSPSSFPSSNSAVTYETTLNSSTSSTVLNSSIPATAFHSNGENLMQICSGQTTLSGTIEVQPDQKGVVRLHIESPENSNQGSDLSSISDITRTLECASKAISRTNAECNTQVPYSGTCETTATVTVITTNTSTLARTGQQIIVVTPTLNQPQLHIQSPNIKFRILHSVPKVEESVDLVGVPNKNSANQLNQIRMPVPETPSICTANLKRPSSDIGTSNVLPDAKKPRLDTKTPLLEATLRLPTPVPCTVSNASVNAKPFQETQPFLIKSSQIDNLGSTPKLTTAKAVAVPVHNVEFPNEREVKTFSGLSSACDNPSLASPSQVPPRSMSSTKLEFMCDWKDCGLKFTNPGSVFLHASKVHTPPCNDDMICQWEGCDSMKRKRFSLLTHLQDWHCNERVLHTQAIRRKQLSQQGKTTIPPPQKPPLHPGYAPDAALLAIRRHALQYINPKELSEDKESALTKSIRLTSALILRNLVTHSALARTYAKRFESELAYLAMSPVESARTIAQCLSQLSRTHD